MKLLRRLLLIAIALGAHVVQSRAVSSPDQDAFEQFQLSNRNQEKERKPGLDPKRIINASSSFLKEREPEMNAEEYAIYEKVVNMLSTRPAFAVKMLETMMLNKEEPSPAFAFILGNAYYTAGQTDKAELSYKNALKRYPTFLRAWSNLGILYYTAQNYDEAIRCLSKCISLGDREPATSGLLGYSLEQKGKSAQAENAYMQALAGDPANSDWLEGLLRIHVRGKQFGRAEELIKDLIAQHPKEPRYRLTYAEILMGQGRKFEAIATLETATASDSAGAAELTLLADLYAEHHLVPEAIAVYRRLLAEKSTLGEKKMLNFARMLTYRGNLEQARQVLDNLRPHLSDDIRVDFLQAEADVFVARKQWPQVETKLKELLTLSPMNGPALFSLGRAYLVNDDLPHATLAFEEASQTPECTYRASLELATIELKNQHYDKQSSTWRRP